MAFSDSYHRNFSTEVLIDTVEIATKIAFWMPGRQITMSSNLHAWQRRLQQMKECKSIAELVRQHGEPHKIPQAGFEIWHYPLGVAGGTLYSIHVSVWDRA